MNIMNEKVNITHTDGITFQVIAAPHNLQFKGIENRCFVFRVIHYPYKKVAELLVGKESGEVQDVQVFLCAQVCKNETTLFLEVRYGVKTWQSSKIYTVEKKEARIFGVEAGRDQIIRIVEPYLSEAFVYRQKSTAENMIRYFTEWAHPPKLEDLIASMTEDEKEQAVKWLKKRFAA